MDLQADIKWIHKELDKVNDPTLIEAIKNILQFRKNNTAERISLEQYNEELDFSLAQIEEGKTYTQEEMVERIKKWASQ